MSRQDPSAPSPSLRLARALDFAARMHAHHRRKGAAQEPYVNHLAEVARLLAEATDGADTNLIMAGLLHDTVEDTETTFDDLEREFGPDVAGLVREVTDDKSQPKAERKRRQIQSAPQASDRAKMLKLADKISNLRSMVDSPPAGWEDDRIVEYYRWAKRVAAGCRGVNERLEALFDAACNAGPETDDA